MPAESSAVVRWRPCANCGEPVFGWWCSAECRRAEDGDERDGVDDREVER